MSIATLIGAGLAMIDTGLLWAKISPPIAVACALIVAFIIIGGLIYPYNQQLGATLGGAPVILCIPLCVFWAWDGNQDYLYRFWFAANQVLFWTIFVSFVKGFVLFGLLGFAIGVLVAHLTRRRRTCAADAVSESVRSWTLRAIIASGACIGGWVLMLLWINPAIIEYLTTN
ncbi:MAG: hypothetical protein WD768_11755 [Phycisphaeraceae bacterium]